MTQKEEMKLTNTEGKQLKPRSFVFGKMFLTGTLLLSLSGCASVAGKQGERLQPKEETRITRVSQETVLSRNSAPANLLKPKEEPHCTKASKKVTKNGMTRTFIAETCEGSNSMKTSFDYDDPLIQPFPKIMPSGTMISVINKEIFLGNSSCLSWLIKGESDSYRFLLVSDITSIDGNKRIPSYWIDTGVLVGSGIRSSAYQQKDCTWIVSFASNGETAKFVIYEDGRIEEIASK